MDGAGGPELLGVQLRELLHLFHLLLHLLRRDPGGHEAETVPLLRGCLSGSAALGVLGGQLPGGLLLLLVEDLEHVG